MKVIVDLVMGAAAVLIGTALLARNGPITRLMMEGDENWRGHPVFSRFEPTAGPLTTHEGRMLAFRAWVLFWSAGFVLVGGGLLGRAII